MPFVAEQISNMGEIHEYFYIFLNQLQLQIKVSEIKIRGFRQIDFELPMFANFSLGNYGIFCFKKAQRLGAQRGSK